MARVLVFVVADGELDADRRGVRDLLEGLSDLYLDRGVDLRVVDWDPYEPDPGTREDNQRLMEGSDLCVFLFLTRADPRVADELERLIRLTRGRGGDGRPGRPYVATWFRDPPDGVVDPGLEGLRARLSDVWGHFWNRYPHVDSLKLGMLLLLVRCLDAGSGVEIRGDGERTAVYLDGRRLDIDLNHVASYRGYRRIRELDERYHDCDLEYRALRGEYQRNEDDDELRDRYAQVASEHASLLKELERAYGDYLRLLDGIAEANDGGRPVSPRLADAYHALQDGDVPHALEILDLEAITAEAEHDASAYRVEQAAAELHARLAERHRDDLRDRVAELLARDDALRSKPDTPSNREQRLRTLEAAARLEHDLRLGLDAQNRLSVYHYDQHDYESMERVLTPALRLARELEQENHDQWGPDLATTLVNLGNLHRDIGRFEDAEAEFKESLRLCRELARCNPGKWNPDLAEVLNDLAALHYETGRYEEAEAEYEESLRLFRELDRRDPDACPPAFAMTLGNLAVLHRDIGRFGEAEAGFEESLRLFREIARRNPDAWNSYLARVLVNFACMHRDIGRFGEAEAGFEESLRLFREIARRNPDAWNSYLAATLGCLACMHYDIGRYAEAENEYKESLRLRRELARRDPDKWNPDLAQVLNNLATLHQITGRFEEAKREWTEALRLAELCPHPDKDLIRKITEHLRQLDGER
ncbi:tetratricopeptide repeat protein [Bifidobacterium sp. MA2]|uniref:Tetratricopeptide repeat protein n=1 Tax=Bifidobacterium santillanense TaxID=2809028 RepID=A0ABS5UR72_9BIFI|nr:tetratricopeptide repeat protein [Bifidobacterium santillanense]MBT1173248.1 tetratricopeptide repeat protein [Bifidobacterium santillanense]